MIRNRLKKKCFIVSLGMHLLLLLVVVFGVAFATTQKKEKPVKLLSISLFREPATRKASQQSSQPRMEPHQARRLAEQQPVRRSVQPSAAKKRVTPQKTTPSPKTAPKPKKTTPKKKSTPKKPKKKAAPRSKPKRLRIPKISISRTVVNKSSSSSEPSRSTPSRPVNMISVNPSAAKNLKSKLSNTVRAVTFRPGSSSYSNYKEWVRQKYQKTWNSGRLPSQHYRQVVTVRVTVLSSGKVASARILKRSGQAPLDASVQSTLNMVKSIGRAFPSGVTESRQAFTIDFQMQ